MIEMQARVEERREADGIMGTERWDRKGRGVKVLGDAEHTLSAKL